MYIAKPDEVRRLTLEIVEILRKSSEIDVAEDVLAEMSQIMSQNINNDDFEEEDYNEEYDLHLNMIGIVFVKVALVE